jgi:hypothetical protein
VGAAPAPPPRGVQRHRPVAAAGLVLRCPRQQPVVLVDTGVGEAGTPGATWIGASGRLPQELAAAGADPDEVDVVILTHLHLDHVGWNLPWDGDQPRARFPQGRYLIQRADWELFASQGDDNDREAFERCVRPLQTLRMSSCWTATASWIPSSRCCTRPGTPRLAEPAGPLRRRGGPAVGRCRQPSGPGRRARLVSAERRPAPAGATDQAGAAGPDRDQADVACTSPLPRAVRPRRPDRGRSLLEPA